MKKYIFAFLILAFISSYAQNKYMIYFKDKGTLSKESLSKISDKNQLAKKYLSKKSIERRKKSLGENYFTFEDLPVEKNYIAVIQKEGIKISNKLKWFNAVTAYLTDDEVKFLKSKSFVKKIESIKKVKRNNSIIQSSENKRNLKKSSAVHSYDYGTSITQNELSDIPVVHDMGITGEGVRIGILDTGFDWENHISLSGRTVIAEYDFVYKDSETANEPGIDESLQQHNHGTSVFSIMAGFDEGNLIGPAFNSEFILAKTEYLPKEIHAEEDNYAAALEWMDSIGVDITSSSLGYSYGFEDYGEVSYTYADMDGKTTIVTKAAELAFDRGIVVITSAGNEGDATWKYITAPGDGLNTLTIGAVTSDNIVTSFSSEGPTYDGRIKPEIVAMGSSVKNAIAGTSASYGAGGGTSYSAPISAGIAGLLLSAYPHLTNRQIRAILIESGDNVDNPDNERGYGLISALRAITYPNLKQNGNGFTINKIFDPAKNVNENTVEVVFANGSSYPMLKNGNHFEASLPSLTLNENYQIYFNYQDSQGNLLREPASENYNFNYGKLYVDLVVTDVDSDKI
ncbi:MAG: S8 family serine peptidase, partial [Melioribacteraceae bacterium]|nr:S8 family serine peptidase [Melioribacteraceae bacterium]